MAQKKRKKWYLALLNFCRLLIRKFGAFRWMHPRKGYWGVFIWENSHRREFHTGMTFWFRIAFTWWLSHFISRYLKVHFMLIKIHAWFKIANITHELPVPVYRQTKFSPRYSNRGDSRRYDILWWYHVTNVELWEGIGVNSLRRESRSCVIVSHLMRDTNSVQRTRHLFLTMSKPPGSFWNFIIEQNWLIIVK